MDGRDEYAAENPWLQIPAADYEGHMAAPAVCQTAALNALFGDIYREQLPASLAVLGCSTGNGFEHIDPARTARVVGVDINPEYLELADERHAARLPGLELRCADLADCEFAEDSFEMVHAALVFEYLDANVVLRKIRSWLARCGVLAVVLQLESAQKAAVTPTEYASLRLLEPLMRLLPPHELLRLADEAGLYPVREWKVPLESGKGFWTCLLAK
jgi:hypothetical protein